LGYKQFTLAGVMDGNHGEEAGFVEVSHQSTTVRDERTLLREALLRALPEVPPRYFYDDVGSELFERITELDVYYPTRTEISILETFGEKIMEQASPRHIVELGSGAGRKIRLLLDAWSSSSMERTCTMLDINELFLRQSITRLGADYSDIRFRGIVADFTENIDELGIEAKTGEGSQQGRLVVFFAGTMGNFDPQQRRRFLSDLSRVMGPADTFLVGVDLVKDTARLEAAYDDPQGVTAAFNLNMLSVLNRQFAGNFDPTAFRHRALYDEKNAWIEMRLVATRSVRVRLEKLDLDLDLTQGAEIRTELSCKFTRSSLENHAREAGLTITGWYSDPEALFALALLRKADA
jgi:L-histidine Nalpha-methyltransferase